MPVFGPQELACRFGLFCPDPPCPTPACFWITTLPAGSFVSQYSLVFQLQPTSFQSDCSRVAYVVTLLAGRAREWEIALWDANTSTCFDFQIFADELTKVFDRSVHERGCSQDALNAARKNSGCGLRHRTPRHFLRLESFSYHLVHKSAWSTSKAPAVAFELNPVVTFFHSVMCLPKSLVASQTRS